MDFNYTNEQQILKDSVERFVRDHYDLDERNALVSKDPGWSQDHWKHYAELGWLGLPFAEEDGGFGGTPVETMLLMEEFGKGLVVEPYLATVVLAGGALRHAASKAQRQKLIGGIIDGSLQVSFGYAEEQARFDLHDIVTSARADGDAYVLNGTKSVVLNAATANFVIVSARTSGGQIDTGGITLFLVPTDADGVTRENYPTVDGLRASEVILSDVRVDTDAIVGELDQGYTVLQSAIFDGILAVAAEAVGAMEVLYKDTVEYTQQREQFGHPLSDFQVLQHRMVEMFVEHEQCKSQLLRATMEAAQRAPDTEKDVHALKALIGKAGTFVGENAVQLHGGMGMTEELRVGHYFKRLLVIDSQFGNSDYHLEQFIASGT
ncbi:MAG: acyl-CoA dehydrogenase family protein [Pseudomonadales bacterium]